MLPYVWSKCLPIIVRNLQVANHGLIWEMISVKYPGKDSCTAEWFISRVPSETLTVSQPITKFPEMYVVRRFINVITKTLTLIPVLIHKNPIHTLLFNFLKIREILSLLIKGYIVFHNENPTRCNNVSKFYYSIFIWSSTCFGQHTAHHQEPKIAQVDSGFS